MSNSPTPLHSSVLSAALAKLDPVLSAKLIESYFELQHRYTQSSYTDAAYDAIGLSAGKFCEAALRVVQKELVGSFVPFGTSIKNFADECRKLEQLPQSSGLESLRVIIPRALLFAYTIRNKRGIGHQGGDVEANRVDIQSIVSTCIWTLCELIRIYHKVALEDAQGIVDSLGARRLPEVWEVMGRKRVLKPGLDFRQKVLLLLYTEPRDGVLVEDLFDWAEYSSLSMFKSKVLESLHDQKLIEFDRETGSVFLSPLGVAEVETSILKA